METLLLNLHISGAILSLILVILSIVSIFYNQKHLYVFESIAIALTAGFQIITGSLLSIYSQSSVSEFCSKITLYTALFIAIEFFLFQKMKQSTLIYPKKLVLSSFITSAGVFTLSFFLISL